MGQSVFFLPGIQEVAGLLGYKAPQEKMLGYFLGKSGERHLPSARTLRRWILGETTPQPAIRDRTFEGLIEGMGQACPGRDVGPMRDFLYGLDAECGVPDHPWREMLAGWTNNGNDAPEPCDEELRRLIELDEALVQTLRNSRSIQDFHEFIIDSPLVAHLELKEVLKNIRDEQGPTDAVGQALVLALRLYVCAVLEQIWLFPNGRLHTVGDARSYLARLLPRRVDSGIDLPVKRLLDRWVARSEASGKADFADRYMPTEGEEAPIRKLNDWRNGRKHPKWGDLIEMLSKLIDEPSEVQLVDNAVMFEASWYLGELYKRMVQQSQLSEERGTQLFDRFPRFADLAISRLG